MEKKGFGLSGLYRFFLKIKYSFPGKFFEISPPDAHRGFVIIQVDGLSYSALLRAMEKGYTPTLRKLVNRQNFRLVPYHCPAPSNTPYFQTGIMYGNNSGVLGFRWMEKDKGLRVTFKDAASAAFVEERAAKGRPGLLTHGSSYLNLFSGDAERSVFTLSTFATENLLKKKKLRQMDIFFLFLLYLPNLLKTFFNLLTDSLLEFYEWIMVLFSGRTRRPEGIFPFIRLINNVLIRDIETHGAMTDIIRGVPAVYVTFNGYDEIAHHRGPEFSGAFRAVRGIDKRIKKIMVAAKSSRSRAYDIYIFSDHGQTPSMPFAYKYGETLAELIQRTTPETLEISEFNAPQEVIIYEGWKYLEELTFYTLNLPRFVYNAAEKFRALIVRDKPQILPFVWKEEKEQIFVNDSGPLTHLYFNFRKEKVPYDEIADRHYNLYDALMSHPGIGVIVGHGKAEEAVILKWDENLPPEARENFLSLASEKYAGDLILQGSFDEKEIINFEEQLSGHGGIGGDQNRPFFLLPPDCKLDLSKLNNPKDFYSFFFENYTKNGINKILENSQ